MKTQTLLIIGAGPKGLAIAAKNKVLRDLGFQTPKVVLIEKTGVASHWTGKSGYTNGQLELGTSPEKDIGFPYNTTEFSQTMNKEINRRMKAFSWDRYLTEHGQYSEYIDRGKPNPSHAQFASYLAWVANEIKNDVEIRLGEVIRITLLNSQKWEIEYTTNTAIEKLQGDGLVMTGPGAPKANFPVYGMDNIFDIENFWKKMPDLPFKNEDRICLIGAGENSATIAAALGTISKNLKIDIVSPSAFIFSRGESYLENRVYSDPQLGQWSKLTDEDKINFIRRTDLSVFGQYMQTLLNKRRDIEIVAGSVTKIHEFEKQKVVSVEYNNQFREKTYDYVVLATGFDQIQFLRQTMSDETLRLLNQQLGLSFFCQEELEKRIDSNMAVIGLKAKLHLPMLSRMKQGPGFANLSCLGKLSDQILITYVNQAKVLEAVC